ncbi:STY0301 family protein [Roseateles sp. LYH14W]|uniref:STY0301 family protein n=1 Tax=Pelomonas parva TaxID=3299032 RepID=A0ABW7F0D5_9BURK
MVFVCAMAPLSAAAFDVACPEKILTTQKLAGRENGWAGFDPGPSHAYVSGISIYDGHPNDMVRLKPDDEMAKEQIWSFLKAPPNAKPLYVMCDYHLTRVGFIRSLPKGIKKCTVKKTGLLRCEVHEP